MRAQRGQATVEIALCLPFLALFVAILVEVTGLAIDHVRVWHAAREAARVGVVDPDPSSIRAAAEASGLAPLDVDVDPLSDGRVRGEPLHVTIRFRSPGRVPVVRGLFGAPELEAEATMRIERP